MVFPRFIFYNPQLIERTPIIIGCDVLDIVISIKIGVLGLSPLA